MSDESRGRLDGATKRWGWPFWGLMAAVAVYFFGNYHLVWGMGYGPGFVPKVSFAFSEPLVNLDELAGMPLIVARSRYPLFIRRLEHDGRAYRLPLSVPQ